MRALPVLHLVASLVGLGCGGKVVFVEGAAGGASSSSNTCETAVCNVSGDKCLCNGVCFDLAVEERCQTLEGKVSCECRIAGDEVGTCEESVPGKGCDVKQGCCASFWTSTGGQP